MGQTVVQILLESQANGQTKKDVKNRLVPFLFIGDRGSELFAMSALNIKNVERAVLADVHIWVDFTSAKGLFELLQATQKFKTPVVSGSTGLSAGDFVKLKNSAKKRTLFWASNMSPGLWAFRQAIKGFAGIKNFDFAIEEVHHTQKKDKPSGTAKTLHLDLEKIVSKKIARPTSLRLGGVFGIHTVYAASTNEIITMQHQALNRTVFAEGALLACNWLVDKKSGLYSMDDLFRNITGRLR